MGEVDIDPRRAAIPPITPLTVVNCCAYMLLLVVLIKVFMTIKEVIVVMIMEYMKLGINRPPTIPLTTVDKVVVVMGYVDIGLRPDPTL